MNRERLIQLRDFLANHPDRFNYGCWVKDQSNPGCRMPEPECLVLDKDLPKDCGTVGCVAGWAVALFDARRLFDTDDCSIEYQAKEILDLDWKEANKLFLYHLDENHKPYGVDEAIRRINQLLDTGAIFLPT